MPQSNTLSEVREYYLHFARPASTRPRSRVKRVVAVSSAIVAISSIHLLQVFLNHAIYTIRPADVATNKHVAAEFSALCWATIDRRLALKVKVASTIVAISILIALPRWQGFYGPSVG